MIPEQLAGRIAARYNTNVEAIDVLLGGNFDSFFLVRASDDSGATVLHAAAYNTNPKAMKSLLEADTEVNARDKSGKTALHNAVLNENPSIAILLLDNDTDPNSQDDSGTTVLTYYCGAQHESRGLEGGARWSS